MTATKRELNVQDIGISVNALSAARLDDLQVRTAADLTNTVAGVQVNMEYGNAPMFVIRGITDNDFVASTAPAAAMYVDGVYKDSNFASSPPLFDLERVEILKGPQGTLWGRNTTAGAISVISKPPSFEENGYVEVGYGNADSKLVEAAFGDKITDSLAGRVSLQYRYSEGLYEDAYYGVHVGGANDLATRVQLLFQPNDSFKALLTGSYSQQKGESAPTTFRGIVGPHCGVKVNGLGTPVSGTQDPSLCTDEFGNTNLNPFSGNVSNDFVPQQDNKFYTGILNIQGETSVGRIVSITAYDAFARDDGGDFDGTAGPGEVQGVYIQSNQQYSEELRLERQSGPVYWLVGGYYSRTAWNVPPGAALTVPNLSGTGQVINGFAVVGVSPDGLNSVDNPWTQHERSAAGFAHAEWAINSEWTIVGGLRYSDENETNHHTSTYDGAILATNVDNGAPNVFASSDWSYTAGVNWRVNDKWLLYVSQSKGVKSGGFDNNFLTGGDSDFRYGDETLYATEIGSKWEWSKGKINASVFYDDYKDAQERLNQIKDGVPALFFINLDKVVVYGADAEVALMPINGFLWDTTIALLNTRIDDTRIFDPSSGYTLNGSQLPFAPHVALTTLGRYEWAISDNLRSSLQVDVNYTGDHYLGVENISWEKTDYVLVGASAAIGTADKSWQLEFWGKNLNNDIYAVNAYDGAFGARVYYMNTPRTFGVTLKHRF